MKNMQISHAIEGKLRNKHNVCRREIEQCFENVYGSYLIDTREEHRTTPPTMWFISRTNQERILKVVFILNGALIDIKTCYEPNHDEIRIYEKHGNGGNHV